CSPVLSLSTRGDSHHGTSEEPVRPKRGGVALTGVQPPLQVCALHARNRESVQPIGSLGCWFHRSATCVSPFLLDSCRQRSRMNSATALVTFGQTALASCCCLYI